MGPRRAVGRAWRALVTAALVVVFASPGGAALAAAPADLTYDGRLVVLAPRRRAPRRPGAAWTQWSTSTERSSTSPTASRRSGQTGDRVRVKVRTSAPLSTQEALAEVAEPSRGRCGAGRVGHVARAGDAGTQAAAVLPSALGTHTLVVLPVYTTAPDTETAASLQAVAQTTATYWATQSAGRIQVMRVSARLAPGRPAGGLELLRHRPRHALRRGAGRQRDPGEPDRRSLSRARLLP